MDQRYTLSLPPEVYEGLRSAAERRGSTIKEVVQQCLKFGLMALATSEQDNKEIVIREILTDQQTGEVVNKDKVLMFL